jgi:hypothetical protein
MVIAESCNSQSAGDRQKFGELIRQQHVIGGGFSGEFSKKIVKSLRHFAEHFLLLRSDGKSPENKIQALTLCFDQRQD